MAVNRSTRSKSGFLDKVLRRLPRLDREGLQNIVERLQRERALLRTLFDTIEDGIVVVDAQSRVNYLNHAAAQLLGVAADSAVNLPLSRLLPELDPEALHPVEQGKVVRLEFEVHFPRPRFLRLYAAPIEEDGETGLALVLHDATEVRHHTREAVEAERVHALTQLAASVAHEIGNPLNALHIHLQLMEREVRKLHRSAAAETAPDPATTDRLQSYLDVAKDEIGRLDYIVTEFLQAMRPSPPRLVNGSLNDVIRETLNLLRPELENRRLLVTEKLAPKLPDALLDPAQIKQALLNLVKNALQAMTKGGRLTLASGSTRDYVWVTVSDTGGGIPPDQLNRLFQPFYTTKEKGTGLGLMIVQRIVRNHRGRIDFESEVGRGTTFKLWLPVLNPEPRLLPPS